MFLMIFDNFGPKTTSRRPANGLKSFLEVICFNLTEHQLVRSHMDPYGDHMDPYGSIWDPYGPTGSHLGGIWVSIWRHLELQVARNDSEGKMCKNHCVLLSKVARATFSPARERRDMHQVL